MTSTWFVFNKSTHSYLRSTCSTHSGVTCHPSAAAKQRFSKTQTKPDPSGCPSTIIRHPVQPEPDYPGTGETLLFLPYNGVLLLVPGHRQNV